MQKIVPIEFDNQRILLTSQLAEMYEVNDRRISENYNRNDGRYQDGIDYYCLEGDALRSFKREYANCGVAENINKLYLWTEHGALLHAKSLGTDRAWEVYGELVDTYFRAREQAKFDYANLSPELQMFKKIFDSMARAELEQKQQAKALADMNRKLDDTCDLIALNPQSWRKECDQLINRVARERGGEEAYKNVRSEIFQLVDARAGVSLETRLTNKRRRMAEEGACKSKRDKLNKVDIIADDKKLIEIYIAVVKEMAVKYGAVS